MRSSEGGSESLVREGIEITIGLVAVNPIVTALAFGIVAIIVGHLDSTLRLFSTIFASEALFAVSTSFWLKLRPCFEQEAALYGAGFGAAFPCLWSWFMISWLCGGPGRADENPIVIGSASGIAAFGVVAAVLIGKLRLRVRWHIALAIGVVAVPTAAVLTTTAAS